MLDTISRQEWGARAPRSFADVVTLPWSVIDTIYVHYTSMVSDQTGDPKIRMRGIQNFHMDDPKHRWNDVAYNFAFSVGGDILVGRGWNVKSAATGTENGHSVAFVFLGGDRNDRDDLTAKGRSALGKLIREAMALSDKQLIVKGHTEAPGNAGNTECPGLEILSYIHTGGWKINDTGYPKYFFRWAAWYLGEGPYKQYGPRNQSVRPKNPSKPVAAVYWISLQRFLRARKSK